MLGENAVAHLDRLVRAVFLHPNGGPMAPRTAGSSVTLAFYLFKIAVPPVLVAFMSLAARRFGPTFGGLIMGLPWMTGPVLYFLARERDLPFTVAMCTGIEIATFAMSVFALVYAIAARIAPWFICLPLGAAAFAATGLAMQSVDLSLPAATALGIGSLWAANRLMPKADQPTPILRLPWWDIPARMAATFALVAVIMLSAERLGPRLSGLVSSYPVILTVVGSFTHHQLGRNGALRLLSGLTLSLIGFALFFFAVGTLAPQLGLEASFGVAVLASLAFSGTLILLSRRTGTS
jgi:hypothetical protein